MFVVPVRTESYPATAGLPSRSDSFPPPFRQIVVDYQEIENGANGWLRLLQFHPDGTTLTIRDYSPLLNQTTEHDTFVVPPIP